MTNLEYIDSFFNDEQTPEEKEAFEKKIMNDPHFAEEVAFYVSSKSALKQTSDTRRRDGFYQLYHKSKKRNGTATVLKMWKYVAVAAVLVLLLFSAWFFIDNRSSATEIADNYIQNNFTTLTVTMGKTNSIQKAIALYNAKQFDSSLSMFEELADARSGDSEIQKYLGIVNLRLGNYEQALQSFTMLESDSSLYSNPGMFYKAVVFLKRNRPGDKKKAKLLLEEVVDKNLEGKSQAIRWLEDL